MATTPMTDHTAEVRKGLMNLIGRAKDQWPAGIFHQAETEEGLRPNSFSLRLEDGGRIYTVEIRPYGSMRSKAAGVKDAGSAS